VWIERNVRSNLEALIALASRRLATDSTDPYVAYLLNHGVIMAEAAQLRLDCTQNARVMNMRHRDCRAQRTLAAGALLHKRLFFAARDTRPRLSETLGASLARGRRASGRGEIFEGEVVPTCWSWNGSVSQPACRAACT